jgi:hypothetical protein
MPHGKKARKSIRPRADRPQVRAPASRSNLDGTLPLGTPNEKPSVVARSPVEIELHDVRTGPALDAHAHRVVEIWTRQRVYSLDSLLICQEVIDLASGERKANHPILGSRLVGGQTQTDEGAELIFPLPIPGTEAVFQNLDGKGRMRLQITSRVARVTLHVRRVRVDVEQRDAAWTSLTTTGGRR